MRVLRINYRYAVGDTMPNPEKTMENCVLMLQHIQEDSTIPGTSGALLMRHGRCSPTITRPWACALRKQSQKLMKSQTIQTCLSTHGRGSGNWSPSSKPFRWTRPDGVFFTHFISPFFRRLSYLLMERARIAAPDEHAGDLQFPALPRVQAHPFSPG